MAYNDIDSGKVLNKEGLLELSGQIKGYINANIPQEYTLPAATTATLGGVKVDGSTITIEDGVISAAGGGAIYTAGNGINIDNNNVISNTIHDTGVGVVLGMILSSLGNNDGNYVFASSDSVTDGGQAVNVLLSHKVINTTYVTRGLTLTTTDKNTYRNGIGASQDESITLFIISNNGTITIYPLSNAFIPSSSFTFAICSGRVIISIYYNRTTHRFANLPSLGGFPSAPTTDGDYALKVSVSSGTPTYSWAEDASGGTTYTAGTGISITNGVISLALSNAEEGTY